MSVYETIYLIIEAGGLVGQALFDVVSVAFAIMAAGFVMGDRLTRPWVIGISIIFTLWGVPMLLMSMSVFATQTELAKSLTPEQLGELQGLMPHVGATSFLTSDGATYVITFAHALLFGAAIWFLNYCSKRPSYLAPKDA